MSSLILTNEQIKPYKYKMLLLGKVDVRYVGTLCYLCNFSVNLKLF